MKIDDQDFARALRSADNLLPRWRMLREPHIAPLTEFVQRLREAQPNWEFPDFDPLDGGIDADILFLFEKPGPMAGGQVKGSGFISRNNDDPTAEAMFDFMTRASLPRKRTVIWNVVPGWNGTRKVTAAELQAGVDALKHLFPLIPKLRTVVLVGRKAQRATSHIESLGLRILTQRACRPAASVCPL